jgi:Glucose-6-phosphate dehydrogenase subunit
VSEAVWTAERATPAEVEEALRHLVQEQHAADHASVPGRALNLVAVVDRAWRGEVANRLARVGRYHASRTVVCAVEPGRTTLSARAVVQFDDTPERGEHAAVRETVFIDMGESHLRKLDRIVDPIVVTDVATAVWAPHGHQEAVDALCHIAQAVVHDSGDDPDPDTALARARDLIRRLYVVDLAWLRGTPWRERIAAAFDPPQLRDELRRLSAVTVRHSPDGRISGQLLLGWLACRLGWPVGDPGVALALEPVEQDVRGLAGVTIESSAGLRLALDRGRGGLTARRRLPGGRDTSWTVLGASRGESGILGEGIRQALLRDPTYEPALACAEALAA